MAHTARMRLQPSIASPLKEEDSMLPARVFASQAARPCRRITACLACRSTFESGNMVPWGHLSVSQHRRGQHAAKVQLELSCVWHTACRSTLSRATAWPGAMRSWSCCSSTSTRPASMPGTASAAPWRRTWCTGTQQQVRLCWGCTLGGVDLVVVGGVAEQQWHQQKQQQR